jgi:hypothetical protein
MIQRFNDWGSGIRTVVSLETWHTSPVQSRRDNISGFTVLKYLCDNIDYGLYGLDCVNYCGTF